MHEPRTAYQTHEIEEHLIQAKALSEVFKIRVLEPMSRTDGSERFPVVYVTDGDHLFGGLSDLATLLQIMGDTSRFILVGICYAERSASRLLRWRDFIPHEVRSLFKDMLAPLAHSALASGVEDAASRLEKTDARQFLQFIREELMPFINARYPTVREDCSYSGYSLGGTFGLYTLFTQPDTFRRYVIGSPGTSYCGNNFAIALAQSFLGSGQRMNARVFMSVGELEEFERAQEQFDLVTGCYLLAKFLRQSPIPGLDLTSRTFAGESHATAWTLAFSHGLKALLPPHEAVPEWLRFLTKT